ncbi:AMP-binding protein [Streptomyces sp. NPDC001732]
MSNLFTALTEAAKRYPQRPALRIDGTALTLLELDELSARVTGGLLAHGVRPGDRVEMTMPGVPAFPVLYFGALRAGAVVVAAAPRTRPTAVRPRDDARGARLVFAPPEARHVAGEEPSDTAVVRVGPDFLDQVAFWPQHPGVVHREDDDVAVVVDSAGRGRGARHDTYTHGAAREEAAAAAKALPTAAADGTARPAPGSCPARRRRGHHAVDLAGTYLFMPHVHTPETAPGEYDDSAAGPLTPAAGSSC